VKLRKAPTKAEIELMAAGKKGQPMEEGQVPPVHHQLEVSAEKPPEYVDLNDFKSTLTATFVIPE
jgi:hypothetical protein